MFPYKPAYRRNLPHYQPEEATFFITFRLAGSLPAYVLQQLADERKNEIDALLKRLPSESRERELYVAERRAFGKWDGELDSARSGPSLLSDERLATILAESMRYRDGRDYKLQCFCIMPNHVHMVATPTKSADGKPLALASILYGLKRYTANRVNELLGRSGSLWQHESYDHAVRNIEELRRIVIYVLNNPVKAGLPESHQRWPWTYLADDVL